MGSAIAQTIKYYLIHKFSEINEVNLYFFLKSEKYFTATGHTGPDRIYESENGLRPRF